MSTLESKKKKSAHPSHVRSLPRRVFKKGSGNQKFLISDDFATLFGIGPLPSQKKVRASVACPLAPLAIPLSILSYFGISPSHFGRYEMPSAYTCGKHTNALTYREQGGSPNGSVSRRSCVGLGDNWTGTHVVLYGSAWWLNGGNDVRNNCRVGRLSMTS